MMLCLPCKTTRYTKHRSKCPICKNTMTRVDGPLRKIVELLHKADLQVRSAICTAHNDGAMCEAEIIINFEQAYNDLMFKDLPKRFDFVSDKNGPNSYTLMYVLNYTHPPTSMLYFNAYDKFSFITGQQMLKESIADLYKWAQSIHNSGLWAVSKLAGYL